VSRVWQQFSAPGPDEEPLPAPASPWITGHSVRLPREYWELLIDFARRLDAAEAERLLDQSGNAGWGNETIEADPATLPSSIAFMERVEDAIQAAPELVPEATEALPDAFVNEELARMVRAVRAVYEDSLRRGEPFDAWTE
jgi:hypothetical protein